MPLVARKDGSNDVVNTTHVATGDAAPDDGSVCDAATLNVKTDQGSGDVFVEGHGVVRQDDTVENHAIGGTCSNHASAPKLTSFSPDVYANGKKLGRKGDQYSCSATITSITQTTVFANGS
tara:strand:- start:1432 stop:1794 length:363 start_codon:yes stop_codon:yes gene_type:complete